MMIVWFGESPSLLRDHVYVSVRYAEAPGVAEGIPVRKSGIRVGEVTSITFDERPNKPDGVLVTLSLDRNYQAQGRLGSPPVAVAHRRCRDRPAARQGDGADANVRLPQGRAGDRRNGRSRSLQGDGSRDLGVRKSGRYAQVD